MVANGPYRWVRHPAYLAPWWATWDSYWSFVNGIALAVWAGLFVPMVVRRILVEEPVLFELSGYREYAARTQRLIPLVW